MSPDMFSSNGNSHGLQRTVMEALDGNTLRRQLVANVSRSELSADDKLKTLTECVGQIKHRRILEKVAVGAGLTLSRFLTNDALELF